MRLGSGVCTVGGRSHARFRGALRLPWQLVARGPCPRHHVPTHDTSCWGHCPGLTRKGRLGPRALVHEHLLILPVSSGHELVPLSRWGALLGKEAGSKGESRRRATTLPLGSPPGAPRTAPLCSRRPDLPSSVTHVCTLPSLLMVPWSLLSAPRGFSCSCLQLQYPGGTGRTCHRCRPYTTENSLSAWPYQTGT